MKQGINVLSLKPVTVVNVTRTIFVVNRMKTLTSGEWRQFELYLSKKHELTTKCSPGAKKRKTIRTFYR